MKLAIYCPDYYPSISGYSFAFQDFVRGLCSIGCQVDVFTPIGIGTAKERETAGLRIIRINHTEPLSYIKYIRAIYNIIVKPKNTAALIQAWDKNENYNAVVFETIEDPLIFLLLPKHVQNKSVVRVHGCTETELAVWSPGILLRMKGALIAYAFKFRLRYITATVEFYLDFVRRYYLKDNALRIADKRFAVIPNSAPGGFLAQQRQHGGLQRRRYVTLGRMDWVGTNQKGFDDILMALLEMTAEQRKSIHLTFVGQGGEQARLRRVADGIPDAEIEFIDHLPNAQVRQLLGEVDGVILASRYEGMSVFALEAVGAGAPVIFSDAGGIAGLVRGNGRRFKAGDPHALASAWSEMLSATPEQCREMSEASLAIAASLTPELSARKFLRFVKVVLPRSDSLPN